jgi:ABC-type nitrate/sulfonate/bicarbonate transport system substrate-binding protein
VTKLSGRAVSGRAMMRLVPKRALGTVAMVCAGALLLAACSSSSTPSTPKKAVSTSAPSSSVPVVIGYENNGADPSMVTIANNYFQKYLGSNVTLKLFSSGPVALGAIASDSLQFMCGIGLPPVISAIAKGVPLAVVWNQERYTTDAGIVVKASTGITSLAGLRGQTIGIVTGSESSFELPALLAQKGIPLSAVHQLNMASPAAMESAWADGEISAAIVWDPAFGYLVSHGGRILATDASLPPTGTSFNICVANKSFISAHPDVAVNFEKAMEAGVHYYHTNPSQAIVLMEKEAGITAATAKEELAGYDIYNLADQVTEAVLGSGSGVATAGTTESLTNNWKELYSQGFLSVPPPSDMAAYVDPVPAQSALG